MMHPKDIALAPIYLYQARKLKRDGLSLPEPEGERHGMIPLQHYPSYKPNACEQSKVNQIERDKTLNIVMIGDSSAAGVGVNHQEEALFGHLLNKLSEFTSIQQQFDEIDWALHATKGHTSFDILRRLYVLPKPSAPVDVMLVLVGVNDTTGNVSLETWRDQLSKIITLSKRKFGARHMIFPCLPPMAHMPSIPRPLNNFVGAKSDVMNVHMQQVIDTFEDVSTIEVDFSPMGLSAVELFSEDGFHPNSIAYEFWADKLAEYIVTLLKGEAVER